MQVIFIKQRGILRESDEKCWAISEFAIKKLNSKAQNQKLSLIKKIPKSKDVTA